ncbi:hypothetical protein ACFSCW_10290 [Sphingomonas tabacisoli]|uniref:Sulfur globule protein n=1 Tax=Sphingomonas tabacisoli TaxID=2249466 RepID=A0ABW4I3F3_9SPHN
MIWKTGRNILIAAAAFAGTAAMAQPAWAPPPDWGPGWSRWEGRDYGPRWRGPAYYRGPGRHHGWYNWRGNYYQNCGWRWTRRHVREWRCY